MTDEPDEKIGAEVHAGGHARVRNDRVRTIGMMSAVKPILLV